MADKAVTDRPALGVRWLGLPLRRGGAGSGELRHLWHTRAGRILVGSVAAIAALTAIGLVSLWPHAETEALAKPRTVSSEVVLVADVPCTGADSQLCRLIDVRVDGAVSRLFLGPVAVVPRLAAGDSVRLIQDHWSHSGKPVYSFSSVDRRGSVLWLAIFVAAVAALVLRWRGVFAVAGVGLSLAIVLKFLVPGILAGRPAMLMALVAALAVMFVTVVLTNGLGAQTFAAAFGISATLLLTCGLAVLAVRWTHLDGTTFDDAMLSLGGRTGRVSLTGIMLASMLVGALGVLADTAVTQASAVMALRRANPSLGSRALFRGAFTIGRDHLSATIHTLVLAYAGAALPALLLLQSARIPAVDALGNHSIAEPVVATAVGCLALIAAVPLTTGLGAVIIGRLPVDALPDGHGHHH